MEIKKERNATRCEICHQKDNFDPNMNHCLRCDGFVGIENKKLTVSQTSESRISPYFKIILVNTLGGFISSALLFVLYQIYIINVYHPFEQTYEMAIFMGIIIGVIIGSPIGLTTGILAGLFKSRKWFINVLIGLAISYFVFYLWFGYRLHTELIFSIITLGIFSGLLSTYLANNFYKFHKSSFFT